jgi:hypothetical protein
VALLPMLGRRMLCMNSRPLAHLRVLARRRPLPPGWEVAGQELRWPAWRGELAVVALARSLASSAKGRDET